MLGLSLLCFEARAKGRRPARGWGAKNQGDGFAGVGAAFIILHRGTL